MTASTCKVKGTGEKGSGMAIWAATAVTAAISAARVIMATFKSSPPLTAECGSFFLAFTLYCHLLTGISGASSILALSRGRRGETQYGPQRRYRTASSKVQLRRRRVRLRRARRSYELEGKFPGYGDHEQA